MKASHFNGNSLPPLFDEIPKDEKTVSLILTL